jgi:hypothetical protein
MASLLFTDDALHKVHMRSISGILAELVLAVRVLILCRFKDVDIGDNRDEDGSEALQN